MSMQVCASSKSPSHKKRMEGLFNQTFMINLFPKQSEDDRQSTKERRKNIVAQSRVSRKLGAWYPGFNPILYPDHRILGTALVADSKHHWIIKWDAIKSTTVSKIVEHHYSLHHSTALQLEDNHKSKVLVGIIPNRDDEGLSRDSDKPGYCTQPDVDASTNNQMMQSTDDDTSLSGSISSNLEDKAGINLTNKTIETSGKKRESTAKDLILVIPLNVPVVTPY